MKAWWAFMLGWSLCFWVGLGWDEIANFIVHRGAFEPNQLPATLNIVAVISLLLAIFGPVAVAIDWSIGNS